MFPLNIIAIFLLLFFGTLGAIGWYLAPQDELKKADAIVAISGDNGARFSEAGHLYLDGYAEKLIFSGAAFDVTSQSNAAIFQQKASRNEGIIPKDILLDETSTTTRENALNVAKIVRSNKFESIILVTSPYHQRRASIEFREALGPEVEIINYSAKDENWRRSKWWMNPRGWYLTVTETPKVAFAMLRNAVIDTKY